MVRVVYMWQNKLYPDRVYIGQEEESKILTRYKKELKSKNKANRKIIRNMIKNGFDNFDLSILYRVKTENENVDIIEKYFVDKYEEENYALYNGSYIFKAQTKEQKEKQKKTLTGQIYNSLYKGKVKQNKYGLFGITFNVYGFYANITLNGKKYSFGRFDDPIDAAIAYDKKCFEIYGPNNRINFPEFFINTKIGDDYE